MIQREWTPCTVITLSEQTNKYGQRRLFYSSKDTSREIFIKPYRERESNNPKYLDTEYFGLIKGDISTNQLIQVGDKYFRIIDTIYAPKFTQLFMKETQERPRTVNTIITAIADPEEWGITTGSGEYIIGAQATLTATGNPPKTYYLDHWSNGETTSQITITVTEDDATYTAYFKNYVAIDAFPRDQVTGNVWISTKQGVTVDNVTAVPKYNQRFSHWSDGSTANPHEPITLGSEKVYLTAYFDTIDYTTITCTYQTDDSVPVAVTLVDGGSGYFPDLLYSINGGEWTSLVADTAINLNVNDKLYLKAGANGTYGINTVTNANTSNHFTVTGGDIALSGDITTLINEYGGINDLSQVGTDGCHFARMFSELDKIRSISGLKLPQIIGSASFHYAFYGSGIRDLPDLSHITKVYTSGFGSAFRNCWELVGDVDISSITEYAEVTPGNEQFAFNNAFNSATLTSVKIGSAPLKYRSLNGAFNGCQIGTFEVGFTSWGNDGTKNWLLYADSDVKEFRCPAELGTNETIMRGSSYCPNGWTVINI